MDKLIHMHTNTRVCMHAPTDKHTDVPSCLGRLEWKVRINFFLLLFSYSFSPVAHAVSRQ